MNPFEIIGWIIVGGFCLSASAWIIFIAMALITGGVSTLRYKIAAIKRRRALRK